MKYMRGIVAQHPSYSVDHNGQLVACIESCSSASASASACADVCLSQPHADEMATCIRMNLDLSDIASATARVLTRHVGHLTQAVVVQVNALAVMALACAIECDQQEKEHTVLCAQACRALVEACNHVTGSSSQAEASEKGVDQEAALH